MVATVRLRVSLRNVAREFGGRFFDSPFLASAGQGSNAWTASSGMPGPAALAPLPTNARERWRTLTTTGLTVSSEPEADLGANRICFYPLKRCEPTW
jgi:hypothetical protein